MLAKQPLIGLSDVSTLAMFDEECSWTVRCASVNTWPEAVLVTNVFVVLRLGCVFVQVSLEGRDVVFPDLFSINCHHRMTP